MTSNLSGLYAITDSKLMPDDQQLQAKVKAALEGGATVVQYRDKTTDAKKRLEQASQLVELCHRYNALLIINDDSQLAADCNADGVHLGQSDGNVAEARNLLGDKAVIGVTCHDDLSLAQHAAEQGANYIAFGAFFPSKTKPNARPAPLELLQQAKQQFALPIVAIGGISIDNATQVIEAGADMIAVVHALFGNDDIKLQAEAFAQNF